MHECRIYETNPFLKESPSPPLYALYKKPYSIVRVESDGSIFTYHSPHSMNVYLSLKYSQLYLNWGFVEENDNLRLLEYNMEFPYTGTIVCSDFGACSFKKGQLVERENPEAHTSPKLSADVLSLLSGKDMELFIRSFCSRLKRLEKERQEYIENLSRFLHVHVPHKNQNQMFDEIITEKLHKYIYFDNICVEDEYGTVGDILIDIAKETYENSAPKDCTPHFYDLFTKEEQRAFRKRLHNAFNRSELNAIIKFWLDYVEVNDASMVPDEQKIDLLTLLNIAPSYSKPQQSSHLTLHCHHKIIRPYLDD